MTCECSANCFDKELTAHQLEEQVAGVTVAIVMEPVLKAIVNFTCIHGQIHRHTTYPGGHDWGWAASSRFSSAA